MAKKEITQAVKELMRKPEQIRNIGIVAHIDHGKTTLTDNLLAGAGMISEELAGKQLAMDFVEQEQERGITIYSANVSMVHECDASRGWSCGGYGCGGRVHAPDRDRG
jgi:elongation factor 2